MKRVSRIALLMPLDVSFCRDVMRGIRAYALGKRNWMFRCGLPQEEILQTLREWRPDGIIAHLMTPEVARVITRMRKPLVDTAFMLPKLKVPLVDVDHEAVGRMAAEHFLERGYTHFGFFGSSKACYAKQRKSSFCQRLGEEGHEVLSCYAEYRPQLPMPTSWRQIDQRVRRWLRQLPKPVAIFTSNDLPARELADMCQQLELNVPEEVAILGVDNDELICEMATPPLSSIAIPAEKIGYNSAKMLDQLISGEAAPKSPILLPPLQVVTRQSTDVLAIEDSAVAAALIFIRQHAGDEIGVNDVVQASAQGRRMLECKFRELLGRTILEEIRRIRIEIAKDLLVSTNLSMPAISQRTGFSGAERFSVVFREVTGMPPREFRQSQTIHDS